MSSERRHCKLLVVGGWETVVCLAKRVKSPILLPSFLSSFLPSLPNPQIWMEVDYPQVEEASTAPVPPQAGEAQFLSRTTSGVVILCSQVSAQYGPHSRAQEWQGHLEAEAACLR